MFSTVRHHMDVEDIMIDPSTNWKPVEKVKEAKEEGKSFFQVVFSY